DSPSNSAAQNPDIWLLDLARETSDRLTNDPAVESTPRWSFDGKYVFYVAGSDSVSLYRKAVIGTEQEPTLLLTSKARMALSAVSLDGRYLLYQMVGVNGTPDIWYLPLNAANGTPGTPLPYLQTSYSEGAARFSPDGRYVAYVSNSNGENEVYVQTFP